jgi:hypothetical protein
MQMPIRKTKVSSDQRRRVFTRSRRLDDIFEILLLWKSRKSVDGSASWNPLSSDRSVTPQHTVRGKGSLPNRMCSYLPIDGE